MVQNCILPAVFLLACVNNIDGQYYDFFQALQPFVQTQSSQPLNFYNDFTTKRPRIKQKQTNIANDDGRRIVPSITADNRRKYSTLAPIFDTNYFSTTQKALRKTTKTPTQTEFSRQESRVSSPKLGSSNSRVSSNDRNTNREERPETLYFDDTRPSKDSRISDASSSVSNSRDRTKVVSRPSYKNTQNQAPNYDGNYQWNDDGKNSVQYTTRPPYYQTKSYYVATERGTKHNVYTTHNPVPVTHRPGVKPPVVNGPPITNQPMTQRPSFTTRPDTDVVPELIAGPDEDAMSAVEKKRYIDIAEKMCDKYKGLNIKQIQAIPLLPSPSPVKVNVSSCPVSTVPLVIGGKVVTIQEFPHMALIGWKKIKNRGYSWNCGGSLVSNQYVLTAAHCAYEDRDDNIIAGPPRMVQLGSSTQNDPKATYMKVATVIRHPKYRRPKSYFDLAIIKMAATVSFSDTIKPACMGVPPREGKPMIATGWGITQLGGQLSRELRSVSVPVWSISDCQNALGVSMKIPEGPSSESQVCAGVKEGGRDTCKGDSGGPAQVQDGCLWRVVAVTSVGRSCGQAETPAIYARVKRAFISAVVFGNQAKNDNSDNNRRDNNNQQNGQRNKNDNTRIAGDRRDQNDDYYAPSNQNNRGNNQQNQQNYDNTYNNQQNQHNAYNQYNNNRQNQGSYDSYNSRNNQQNANNNAYNTQTTERNDYYNANSGTGQIVYDERPGEYGYNVDNGYNDGRQSYGAETQRGSYNGEGNVWWT